jgi:hypothetical protein
MSSDSEFVRLDVPAVLKAHPSTTTFIFAFRTSRQSGKLMSIGLENGHQIDVDLIDGYLILVNYLVHPVRLLSDGNWHIVYVDLALLSLRFDGPSQTAISLLPSTYNHAAEHHRSGSSGSEGMRLVEINLLLNGEITALRLRKSAGSQQLLCAGSELLTVRQQALPNTYRISVCSPGEEEKSSCNCLGPNSALNPGPGITACSTPKPESGTGWKTRIHRIIIFMYVI